MSGWDDEESGPQFERKLRRIKNPNTIIHTHHGGEHVMLHGVAHKSCSVCASLKPLNKFWKNSKSLDGYRSRCIECDKKEQHQ